MQLEATTYGDHFTRLHMLLEIKSTWLYLATYSQECILRTYPNLVLTLGNGRAMQSLLQPTELSRISPIDHCNWLRLEARVESSPGRS